MGPFSWRNKDTRGSSRSVRYSVREVVMGLVVGLGQL